MTIVWSEWCVYHEWGLKVDSLMDSEMEKCRLDLLVTLCQRSQVVIIEVACASEPHIGKREVEKQRKYTMSWLQIFGAPILGNRVTRVAHVFGDLGSVHGFKKELNQLTSTSTECKTLTLNGEQRLINQICCYFHIYYHKWSSYMANCTQNFVSMSFMILFF